MIALLSLVSLDIEQTLTFARALAQQSANWHDGALLDRDEGLQDG
jgi:hypothetical protein